MFVLDTDHLSVLERGGAPSLSLALRLSSVPDEAIFTTIVSYEEQCKGWLAKTARAKGEGLLSAYHELNVHLQIYAGMQVLPFDRRAFEQFQQLQQQKTRGGTQDLKIAAIALANEATLLTRNTRHFEKIPGLLIEDWTTE